MNQTIQTTCPYCGVGCGISAQVDAANRCVTINGDDSHPANFGRLCSKGSKFLPYQLSMVGYWPTMALTGNGELGFGSGEGA